MNRCDKPIALWRSRGHVHEPSSHLLGFMNFPMDPIAGESGSRITSECIFQSTIGNALSTGACRRFLTNRKNKRRGPWNILTMSVMRSQEQQQQVVLRVRGGFDQSKNRSRCGRGGKASAVFSGERPGCLTAYVVLLYGPGIAGGILAAVAGIAYILIDLTAGSNAGTGTGISPVFFGILMALFCYWIARGFWDMRSWARYWALFQQGLSVPGSISLATPILAGLANGDTSVILVTAALSVIGLGFAALNGYTVYWFAVNGKYFS
jgi:hypothetical protein